MLIVKDKFNAEESIKMYRLIAKETFRTSTESADFLKFLGKLGAAHIDTIMYIKREFADLNNQYLNTDSDPANDYSFK